MLVDVAIQTFEHPLCDHCFAHLFLQIVIVMASSSAASSSLSPSTLGGVAGSLSTLGGVAGKDTSNEPLNNILSWGMAVVQMLHNLLAIGYDSTSASRNVVPNVDAQHPGEVFQAGEGILGRFATSGLGGFADGTPRIPILRWLCLPEVQVVLHNGEAYLADFVPDDAPREPILLGDSCMTFKNVNKQILKKHIEKMS